MSWMESKLLEQSRDFGLVRAEVARNSVPFYWAGEIVKPPLPSAEHHFVLHGSIDTSCGADSMLPCYLYFSMHQSRSTQGRIGLALTMRTMRLSI
jgi:hypothetical protein